MRCYLCQNISWQALCKNCLETTLKPSPSKRVLKDGLVVYYAYKYSEIKNLLHTKHTYHGASILAKLTKHALLPLVKTFTCRGVYSLPIDDHTRSGYSHSAVIAKELEECFKPLYGKLRAKNKTRYSGQKLYIREQNKRDFSLTCKEGLDIILIDDIVTTGNTLREANSKARNLNVLFAIVLADAKD
jgi:competence protein ComFC